MELSTVISQLGLRGATSHRTYERMVETWIDPNEPIPTYDECVAKWNELVASGYFEPPYHVKRAEAYANEGIYLQDIAELTAELAMAKAANNEADIAKYEARLAKIYAKRWAIKAQYPKA
jgi:CRISPR/Cas system-associated endonuclease Cas1